MVKIIDKLNANLVSNPNGTFFSYEVSCQSQLRLLLNSVNRLTYRTLL